MAAFTAGSYAELVSKYPRAGGAALYVHRAFEQPFISFMVAFAVMASGITSASALARGFGGDYLSEFVDDQGDARARSRCSPSITLINLRGIAESVKLNVGFTIVEIGGLLLIVVIARRRDRRRRRRPGPRVRVQGGRAACCRAILAGAALAFYALIGFEDSVNVAEETQEPSRTYPQALFGGLAIAGVHLRPGHGRRLRGRPDRRPGGLRAARCSRSSSRARSGSRTKVFSAIALLALANGALINMIMASRLLYGMAQEGVVPAPLGRVGTRPAHAVGGDPVHDRDRGGADHHRRPLEARRHHRRPARRRLRDRQRRASSSCAATRSTTSTSASRRSSRSSGSASRLRCSLRSRPRSGRGPGS